MDENSIALRTAEAEAKTHSAALRKELGLFDLVMAQVLLVIVLDFFGTAAKAGSAHVAFWLIAFVLFFIPLAIVVAHLNRLMPLEGGLYEWARVAFGDQIGFLVAWNLWLFVMLYVAVIGLVTTTFVAYALGPAAAWLASSRWLILIVSFTLILTMMMFGALSGFEYVAIFSGECRNAGRNLARSVFITAPFIALLYIFSTSSILVFVAPVAV